jgi:hypothetical protein
MKQLIQKARNRLVTIEQMLDNGMSLLVRNGERAPEPLEVGNAILKDIQEQVVRDAYGNAVFPHGHVVVDLLMGAVPPGASLEPLTSDQLQAATRKVLAELDCRVQSGLSVEVRRVKQPTDEWPPGAVYRLHFDDGSTRQERSTRAGDRLLTLTLSPDRDPQRHQMLDDRIDIGSVVEVRDREGRLVRRNTVCISDQQDPKRSVSRRHAHITASKDADGRVIYALHDDASTYGTRVVRRGETIGVPPGTSGVRLRDGDEVYFGAARVTVSIAAGGRDER